MDVEQNLCAKYRNVIWHVSALFYNSNNERKKPYHFRTPQIWNAQIFSYLCSIWLRQMGSPFEPAMIYFEAISDDNEMLKLKLNSIAICRASLKRHNKETNKKKTFSTSIKCRRAKDNPTNCKKSLKLYILHVSVNHSLWIWQRK